MTNRFKSSWEPAWNEVLTAAEVGEHEGTAIEGAAAILFASIALDAIFN